MKAIGITLGSCALLLMLFQSIKLFITMDVWSSADFLIVCTTMSFLSTVIMTVGNVFNRK
jgi:hypothetical protein